MVFGQEIKGMRCDLAHIATYQQLFVGR